MKNGSPFFLVLDCLQCLEQCLIHSKYSKNIWMNALFSHSHYVLATEPRLNSQWQPQPYTAQLISAWVCFLRKLGPKELIASLDLNALMRFIFSNTLFIHHVTASLLSLAELFDKCSSWFSFPVQLESGLYLFHRLLIYFSSSSKLVQTIQWMGPFHIHTVDQTKT